METIEVVHNGDFQVVRLPKDCEFDTQEVTVQKEGDAVVLRPAPPREWPEGFFDSIVIDDPAFARPEQGPLPPVPELVAGDRS